MTEVIKNYYRDDDGNDWELPPGAIAYERIALDNIEATAATQVRVRIDRKIIEQYTEDFVNGAAFPPLDVFREENSERNILADGFHRHRSAINADRADIGCFIYPGGTKEALIHALGSNFDHGFRRTNADKRHAVEMALKDPELSTLLAQEIADICRVTKRTVNRIINEHMAGDENDSQDGTKSQTKAKDPEPEDYRDTGKEPTQEEVERGELRAALGMIKAFPYDGAEALTRLQLTPVDIADLEYVSTWLANAVIKYRATTNVEPDNA